MNNIKKFKKKSLNKHIALRIVKEFNGIKSFKGRMIGGSNANTSYRDENFNLKIIECIDCREDGILV